MATYNKFLSFLTQLGKGTHHFQAGGDSFKVFLTNQAPNGSTNAVKGDLTELPNTNGYSSQVVGSTDWTLGITGDRGTFIGNDVTFGPASGGVIGPFTYAVLYNDTPTSPAKPLIAWWTYTGGVTLQIGESFRVDFGAAIFDIGP
jgi:hypothetical protein